MTDAIKDFEYVSLIKQNGGRENSRKLTAIIVLKWALYILS